MDKDWKLVYTCNTELEAHHLKGNLIGAEIDCEILSQVDSTRQFTLGELAIVKLYVREEDFEDARKIIEDIVNNDANINDFES